VAGICLCGRRTKNKNEDDKIVYKFFQESLFEWGKINKMRGEIKKVLRINKLTILCMKTRIMIDEKRIEELQQ
ncbi:MAG: hypothetical protein M3O67_04690, partial [Bacteroidota bacterium]|nr:hypothetical protein [Bacteroidota bacterium]